MHDKFVTSSEIASKFGVTDSTVRRWCRRGLFRGADLKFVPPFGSVWVVPISTLQYFKPPKNGRPKMTARQVRQNLIVKLYKEKFKCKPAADLLEKLNESESIRQLWGVTLPEDSEPEKKSNWWE